MARIIIATGIGAGSKGDPFAKFKRGSIVAALNQQAKIALRHFSAHGREYTGGIDEKIETPNSEERVIGSEDQRVIWTALGTRAHVVAPRDAPAMVYQGGNYALKTSPTAIPSRRGGPSGPIVRRTDSYTVSGIDATLVHEQIGDEIEDDFVSAIEKAIGL